VRLRFETAPDGVCGIELSANGQKVAWTIADYLATLDQKVGTLLAAEAKPIAKPASKPEANPKTATAAPVEAAVPVGAK